MPLYRVTVEHTFVIQAKDEDDAYHLARAECHKAVRDDELDLIFEEEITSLSDLPNNWRNSYPYGEPTNSTCEEILKQEARS
jgi:hypothetical protein